MSALKIKSRRVITVGIPVAAVLLAVFGIYLTVLYKQLKIAFYEQAQNIPIRIYSDVTRLNSPETRVFIEQRLKSLAYGFRPVSLSDGRAAIQFALHPMNYPIYLIPENHPEIDALGGTAAVTSGSQRTPDVKLIFDSPDRDGLLQSIELNGKEVSDLYLEPELAATLSPGAGGELGTAQKVRQYVKFADIPSSVWKAVISIEDQHFMEHGGFDIRGLVRAVWVDLRTRSFAQGGSTITQQLVKNLMARRSKNVFKKINELFLAILLEATFDKEQILERYLNEVYLGQIGNLEVRGVAEGAEHFFGKKLEDLTLGESAFLAGLIRGATYYSPYRYLNRAIDRQKLVLSKMTELGYVTESEAKAALKFPIHIAPPQNYSTKAPYFTDFVKAELIRTLKDQMTEDQILESGFRIYTTLDLTMSTEAQASVAQGIQDLEKRYKLPPGQKLEGALATVDHTTGYIRALVGGRNYAQSTFNRILNMKRQVGSTFKPVVYLSAILKGADPKGIAYGPAYPMRDAEWTLNYDHSKQTWAPKNYEKEFLDWTTLRLALAHSVNTVAAQLGVQVGLDKIVEVGHAIGIESNLPAVPSLSLGVAELSPVDLLRAYAVLANHGVQDELTVIRAITHDDGKTYAHFVYHPKQVVDAGAADLMTDMLETVFTEGTAHEATAMGWDRAAAGKTGTTSEHRDAWFAGYTPQLTTVVWVGMDQTTNLKLNLTGAGAALPIWVKFMKAALEGEPPSPFPLSPNLVDVQVDRHSGRAALNICPAFQVLTDKYVRGHEPHDSSCEPSWPEWHPVLDLN